MSLGTKQPNLINTAALLTLRYLARGQSYVPGSAERGGRGANSCSSSQGSRLSISSGCTKNLFPIPVQAAFLGELCFSSIDQAQVETHKYRVYYVLFFFFFEEILLLIALGSLPSGCLSAAVKPLPLWAGDRHINAGS